MPTEIPALLLMVRVGDPLEPVTLATDVEVGEVVVEQTGEPGPVTPQTPAPDAGAESPVLFTVTTAVTNAFTLGRTTVEAPLAAPFAGFA